MCKMPAFLFENETKKTKKKKEHAENEEEEENPYSWRERANAWTLSVSRFVVGSSRAIIPQSIPKDSASARRTIRLASTCQ